MRTMDDDGLGTSIPRNVAREDKGAQESATSLEDTANSSSSSVENSSPSTKQSLSIAQSLERRLMQLQNEHTHSHVQMQGSSASNRRDPLHHAQSGSVDDVAQPAGQASQWSRYQEHRAAARQLSARQPPTDDALEDYHVQSTQSGSQTMVREVVDDSEAESRLLEQLMSILDSPIGATAAQPAYNASREDEHVYEEDGEDEYELKVNEEHMPQSSTAEPSSSPSTPHHSSPQSKDGHFHQQPSTNTFLRMAPEVWGRMGNLAELQGARVSETVPIARQQLLQAGIIGVPNSGKSTLTNALVGRKVSSMSHSSAAYSATMYILRAGPTKG